MKLSEAHKKLLTKLVTSLFPVSAWVIDKKKLSYEPIRPSPWRESAATPSLVDLDVVGFIEGLLDDDSADEAVARRFRAVAEEPLALQDELGRSRWRRTRKSTEGVALLDRAAEFGGPASSNFILTEEVEIDGSVRLSPMTRGELYERCLIAFAALADARGLLHVDMPKAAWDALIEELGTAPVPSQWPKGTPAPLEFLKQLNKDCLYAAWKFDRPTPAAYQEVVALEVGEGRRPGNRYTPDEVKTAVEKLERVLKLKPI